MQQYFEFAMKNWYLFIALVVIIALLIMNTVRARLLGFNELKPGDAVRFMNKEEPLILDVREDAEYKDGFIQGAVHVPLVQLESRVSELASWRDRDVLIYCRAGQRSARAASILKRQGFTHLHKLDGGIMAWQSANLPVSRDT